MDFVIIQAEKEDIPEVCQVHLNSFQGYFLSSFGYEFLKIYYINYLCNPAHLLLVAKLKGKIVGFVAGTINPDLLYQNLFRNNFFSIAKLTFNRFLVSKNFRNQVIKRMYFIRNALKSRFLSAKKHEKECEIERKTGYGKLLSIAVLKSFRGKGVSSALIRIFEKEMHKKGAIVCTLSVKTQNLSGVNFYKKTGWQLVKKTKESTVFSKDLSKNYNG